MTKQELEEKIKNGETVYYLIYGTQEITLHDGCYVERLKTNQGMKKYFLIEDRVNLCEIDKVFATREQAQHYLDHANVTRNEVLPYITWEEFKQKPYLNFLNYKWEITEFATSIKGKLYIKNFDQHKIVAEFDYTEENFYKAYDICKKLFLGDSVDD